MQLICDFTGFIHNFCFSIWHTKRETKKNEVFFIKCYYQRIVLQLNSNISEKKNLFYCSISTRNRFASNLIQMKILYVYYVIRALTVLQLVTN